MNAVRSIVLRFAVGGVAVAAAVRAEAQFAPLRPPVLRPAASSLTSRQAAPSAAAVTNRPAGRDDTPSAEAPPEWVALARRNLDEAVAELDRVRSDIAAERVPLAASLTDLENRLVETRARYDALKRQFDGRALDLNNLRNDIKAREQESAYLSNLFNEYIRNLENRLHIAEAARHERVLSAARLATENSQLPVAEVFACQIRAIEASLRRLEDLVGGDRFTGQAAGPDGRVMSGMYAFFGPVAYFVADEGSLAGIAEQKLGSLEPSVDPFTDAAMTEATREFVVHGYGRMPFDGSLGNARKVEQTRETLWEHIRKGGAVIWPILGVAAVSLTISLGKWAALSLVRMPPEAQLRRLLELIARRDQAGALEAVRRWTGPASEMVRAGVEHLDQSRELVEEVMFERLLGARTRFNRLLPIIAVAAATAPLLGLLGTVTGIISTFKLLTVFGSGDIKMLSAGISEALITTEFGLYVAIPSLLFHSFLSRKAKALSDRMERIAISFLAELEKAPAAEAAA